MTLKVGVVRPKFVHVTTSGFLGLAREELGACTGLKPFSSLKLIRRSTGISLVAVQARPVRFQLHAPSASISSTASYSSTD
jgi:hypothetical protein